MAGIAFGLWMLALVVFMVGSGRNTGVVLIGLIALAGGMSLLVLQRAVRVAFENRDPGAVVIAAMAFLGVQLALGVMLAVAMLTRAAVDLGRHYEPPPEQEKTVKGWLGGVPQ